MALADLLRKTEAEPDADLLREGVKMLASRGAGPSGPCWR
jgi:hypothetical protein